MLQDELSRPETTTIVCNFFRLPLYRNETVGSLARPKPATFSPGSNIETATDQKTTAHIRGLPVFERGLTKSAKSSLKDLL